MDFSVFNLEFNEKGEIVESVVKEYVDEDLYQCANPECLSRNILIDNDTSKYCGNCGMVIRKLGFKMDVVKYNDNFIHQYYSCISHSYDHMVYVKRKFRCLQGKQTSKSCDKVLKTLRDTFGDKKLTSDDIKNFLSERKLYSHYVNINYMYRWHNKLASYDNPFTISDKLIEDVKFIYQKFANYYYSLPEKCNKVKLPPVEFTIRQLIYEISKYSKLKLIELPYNCSDEVKKFKNVKSMKKKRNYNEFSKVLGDLSFEHLSWKYKK